MEVFPLPYQHGRYSLPSRANSFDSRDPFFFSKDPFVLILLAYGHEDLSALTSANTKTRLVYILHIARFISMLLNIGGYGIKSRFYHVERGSIVAHSFHLVSVDAVDRRMTL